MTDSGDYEAVSTARRMRDLWRLPDEDIVQPTAGPRFRGIAKGPPAFGRRTQPQPPPGPVCEPFGNHRHEPGKGTFDSFRHWAERLFPVLSIRKRSVSCARTSVGSAGDVALGSVARRSTSRSARAIWRSEVVATSRSFARDRSHNHIESAAGVSSASVPTKRMPSRMNDRTSRGVQELLDQHQPGHITAHV
jgi:hypothetical protein